MNLSTAFARFSNPLATIAPKRAERVIDSAHLAQVLRKARHGPVPAKLPSCDKCYAAEATVQAGALNYCDCCWNKLGTRDSRTRDSRTCLGCGDAVALAAVTIHPCNERP